MNNHRYRRMLNRLPNEMKELMKYVNHECLVLTHNAGSMGWSVDFHLLPKNKDMFSITIEDLAKEINNEFA